MTTPSKHYKIISKSMKNLITKVINARKDELRQHEAYRLGRMEGYQAGRDEAVEILKKTCREKVLEAELHYDMRGMYETKVHCAGMMELKDDTIKALQDNK